METTGASGAPGTSDFDADALATLRGAAAYHLLKIPSWTDTQIAAVLTLQLDTVSALRSERQRLMSSVKIGAGQ